MSEALLSPERGQELRDTVMLGDLPKFRGQSLAPSIDHLLILERAFHPALIGASLSIADVASYIFILCAPWESVISAMHEPTDEPGVYRFDQIRLILAIEEWTNSLDPKITISEVVMAQKAIHLAWLQIKASGFRSINASGDTVSSEDDVGNSQAPASEPGTRLD